MKLGNNGRKTGKWGWRILNVKINHPYKIYSVENERLLRTSTQKRNISKALRVCDCMCICLWNCIPPECNLHQTRAHIYFTLLFPAHISYLIVDKKEWLNNERNFRNSFIGTRKIHWIMDLKSGCGQWRQEGEEWDWQSKIHSSEPSTPTASVDSSSSLHR